MAAAAPQPTDDLLEIDPAVSGSLIRPPGGLCREGQESAKRNKLTREYLHVLASW